MLDFQRLHVFQRSGAFFVVRVKKGVQLRRRCSHPADAGAGVISDHTVVLTTERSAQHYPDTLRRVRYQRVEDRRLSLPMTNNFDLPALTVALRVTSLVGRWSCFSKWIKRTSASRRFTEPARTPSRLQIWTAVHGLCSGCDPQEASRARPSDQILQVRASRCSRKPPLYGPPTSIDSKDPHPSTKPVDSIRFIAGQ